MFGSLNGLGGFDGRVRVMDEIGLVGLIAWYAGQIRQAKRESETDKTIKQGRLWERQNR